jgi:glycerol transport system ATP-binding protein
VELGLTMVYVTHDQQEALTFADHVTVMRDGDIEQTGSPHELYAEPASQFIGYFIGSPGMNFLEVEVRDASIFFKGQNIGESHASIDGDLIDGDLIDGDLTDAKTTTLGIRPEHVMVTSAKSSQGLAALVGLVEDTGAYKILTLEVEGVALKARVSESMTMREGDSVWVTFPTDACSFFQDARRVGGGV